MPYVIYSIYHNMIYYSIRAVLAKEFSAVRINTSKMGLHSQSHLACIYVLRANCQNIKMVDIDEVAFAEKLMEKGAKSQKSDTAKKKVELDKSKRRVSELDTLYN